MEKYLYKEMYTLERDNWWFKSRRKVFITLIQKYLLAKKDVTILDVGCGTGIMMSYLSKFGSATGVDNSKEAISFCRLRNLKNVHWGDAQKLPFHDNVFDMVVAFDTLEHVKDDKKAVSEFNRVLKKDGIVMVSVPALPYIWSSHDVVHRHYRRYNLNELRTLFQNGKFEIDKLTFINTLLFFPAFSFRIFIGFLNRIGIFKGHTDLIGMPRLFNRLLTAVFSFESLLIKSINFPLGITLLLVAKKKE